MNSKRWLILLTTILAIVVVMPSQTQAQSAATSISMRVLPENPAPNQNVTVGLSSYLVNLDTVLITWFVNGSRVISETGQKTFSTTIGAAGTDTRISASIYLPAGTVEKRITLRPSNLTMLWEAMDSYVPPFYKGKALPVLDTEIKVVAMPEVISGSSMVSAKNMSYAWRKDYSNEQSASGYGKNYFIYINDYLESSNNIEVTASTVDQKFSSRGEVNVETFSPQISFYRKDPKLGLLLNQELPATHLIQGEEIVVAAPYFISPKQIQIPSLVFSWSINGSPVTAPLGTKHIMPLKAVEGVTGTSKLRLDIENRNKIFQTASKEINIQF